MSLKISTTKTCHYLDLAVSSSSIFVVSKGDIGRDLAPSVWLTESHTVIHLIN